LPGYTHTLCPTDWLAAHLDEPDVRVLDGSWLMPGIVPDARSGFLAGHLPGAVLFDIDAIADEATNLPHMVPSPEKFATAVGGLGIGDPDFVVVYDQLGIVSAPRVWWMFRLFGHDRVAVLDGGLPKWKHEGHPVTAVQTQPRAGRFLPTLRPNLLRSRDQVLRILDERDVQIIDARSAGRFMGVDPEPRPGLASGHIPSSANVPYTSLVDPDTGMLLPTAALADRFQQAGVDPRTPSVCTCGSGITACVVALALHRLGQEQAAVYDGAWAEWGADPALPRQTFSRVPSPPDAPA
jgi:thiosulfate/3-mercaptopyruvate sulfurtransferase